MAVACANPVGVAELDQVAVAAVPSRLGDDAIGGGAHRRPVPGGIIGALVRAPAPENRMVAAAEAARDVTVLQRSAQKRAPQRASAFVVEAAIEPKCETRRARDVYPRGESRVHPKVNGLPSIFR